MPVRLNQKADKILAAEIARAAAKDNVAGKVAQKMAMQRLDKLSSTKGQPVTKEELQYFISDLFPDFNDEVLKKAARANRHLSKLWLIPKIAMGLSGLVGLVWLLNLPYPMIRRPVAKTAPLILLPSYLKMDRNYRACIAKVEEADQLVNQATSLADLELGQEKVAQAQQHLDALPVWFLGYEPQMDRTFFSFGWKFTFDEFEAARAKVGGMNAKIFQEINAIKKLEQAQQAIQQAKQNYQQAQNPTSKQKAIAVWEAGIERLNQLPKHTVAKQYANASYEAYLRDFSEVSGLVTGNNRVGKIIAVAEQFQAQASKSCPDSFYPVSRWQQCANLLSKAIAILEKVQLEDAGYLKTQTLLATYEAQLGEISIRQQEEEVSQQAYESAQEMIANLPQSVDQDNRDQTARDILAIINQLEKVKSQTTVYQNSLTMIALAENKLKQF